LFKAFFNKKTQKTINTKKLNELKKRVIDMNKAIYMDDAYLKEFESTIKKVEGNKIILNETAFYPTSGGQPHDTGIILKGDEEFKVINVLKDKGEIIHEVDKEGLSEGDKIKGKINWTRRYNHMKAHTASHILSTIIHNETGGLITGNQLYEDKIRIDFNLEKYDRELLENIVDKANNAIKQNKDTKSYYLPRDEALNLPGASKLANVLPPNIKELRIVEIDGIDVQIDGGTHVKNTKEIGTLKMIKTKNKGKNNRRLTVEFK